MSESRYILKFINRYNEAFYFVAFGDAWPHNINNNLIRETTTERRKATVFETMPEATAALLQAGDPPDWSIELL